MPEAQKSLWDSINTEATEMHEKINFDVNIPHEVYFPVDFEKPLEKVSQDGEPYLIFKVVEGDVDKVIMSSAFTLLRELKKLSPLTGKKVKITKKLQKGKQYFELEQVQ